jgi:hypothetical protein
MPSLLNGQKLREAESAQLQRDLSQNEFSNELVHVHVCVYCGHARKREEIGAREMGSGIFHCPNCESNGPLNVEILERPESPMQ